jgi:hypothetical protein
MAWIDSIQGEVRGLSARHMSKQSAQDAPGSVQGTLGCGRR